MTDETNKPSQDYAQGFAIEGEFVANLKVKNFKIIGQRIDFVKDLDSKDENAKKSKVVLTIQLADGQQCDYFPNKTSQKKIIAQRGFAYKDWISYEGEFFTAESMISGQLKKVIYIK